MPTEWAFLCYRTSHGAATQALAGATGLDGPSIRLYLRAMQRIVGIDPGKLGAIAVLDGEVLDIRDMPIVKDGAKGKEMVDPAALAAILQDFKPDHVWVERVGAMPGNGVVSMFNFGMAYGYARGIPLALGLPVTLIGPAQWKSALQCGVDNARMRASQLLPKHVRLWARKKDDGRAEAALIAYYGRQKSLATPSIEW